jgi:hypothetical protein
MNSKNTIDTKDFALELGVSSRRKNEVRPHSFSSRVAFIGAGMGYDTHLKLGLGAIDHIEQRLILENAISGMTDATEIRARIEEETFISRKNYETALSDLKQGTGISGVDADFEMRMEALCQGHGMENAVRREL